MAAEDSSPSAAPCPWKESDGSSPAAEGVAPAASLPLDQSAPPDCNSRDNALPERSPLELDFFEVENFHFDSETFDPTQDPLKTQLLTRLSSLGVDVASCDIEVLANNGGFNDGMWLLHGQSRQGTLVLKLVRTARRHRMLPTDTENFISIIQARPSIINDHSLAFPIKIFH